jgi:photosystem II stability/assembly factor-like uncharacterized protein
MRLLQTFLIPTLAMTIASDICAADSSPDHWESAGPPAAADCVAVSSVEPEIIYAGTTGPKGGAGVFKSVDGGNHWVEINNGLPIKRINCLSISPASSNLIYVGDEGEGFYRSSDGGSNWMRLNLEPLHHGTAIALDPRDPQTVYLGTDSGIYKSTNGGVNCARLQTGLPGDFTVVRIVLDPRDSQTIYIGTFNDDEAHCGAWKSTNGGISWRGMLNGLSGGPLHEIPNAKSVDRSRMIFALAIDPIVPTTLYAGSLGGGVLKTFDGGEHWTHSSKGIHTGQRWGDAIYSLAIDPQNTKTIYAGTAGGGVFVSSDAGAHWRNFSDGLPPQVSGGEITGIIWNLAISPGARQFLYAANYGKPYGVYRIPLQSAP